MWHANWIHRHSPMVHSNVDQKESLLQAGEKVAWYPAHMKARYTAWVENLKWDWCISRRDISAYNFQFGIAWIVMSFISRWIQLPVDPLVDSLQIAVPTAFTEFIPEKDVLIHGWIFNDSQIVGGWQDDPELYERVFPFSMRPQAHEIIRTWLLYVI